MKLSLEKHFDDTHVSGTLIVYTLRNTGCRILYYYTRGRWHSRLPHERRDAPLGMGVGTSAAAIMSLVQSLAHNPVALASLLTDTGVTMVYDASKMRYEVCHPGLPRRAFYQDRLEAVESLLGIVAEWGALGVTLNTELVSLREKLAIAESTRDELRAAVNEYAAAHRECVGTFGIVRALRALERLRSLADPTTKTEE